MLRITVGFDQRESVTYHTFCQSVLSRSSVPVCFLPLALNSLTGYKESHLDGSNDFIYSRFLTPFLCDFDGWALYVDGDMVCLADINEIFAFADPSKALQVVKHDYLTTSTTKYFGNKNENYPRKNWSSVILWNCSHPSNRVLTPRLVESTTGKFLHRFNWLDASEIGELPIEWNWLATEYENNYDAKLVHYTLGSPCLSDYSDCSMADLWHDEFKKTTQGIKG